MNRRRRSSCLRWRRIGSTSRLISRAKMMDILKEGVGNSSTPTSRRNVTRTLVRTERPRPPTSDERPVLVSERRVRLWLQTDSMQWSREVRFAPRSGHSALSYVRLEVFEFLVRIGIGPRTPSESRQRPTIPRSMILICAHRLQNAAWKTDGKQGHFDSIVVRPGIRT